MFLRLQRLNQNPKFEYRNSKWFDKPFGRLTAMSSVEWLTTLSEAEGQIRIRNDQNPKHV
jgi:hypothetical protein